MDQPDAATLRAWAPPLFDWTKYGFAPATPDPLDVRAHWVVGQLYAITGRTLDSITSTEETAIAQKVLAAFALIEVTGGGTAALAVLEAPWLKSFSAGSYSETRFSPSEIAGGSGKSPPYPPSLWALLWALMTDEKRDEWQLILGGTRAPAGGLVVPDWGSVDEPSSAPLIWGPGIDHWW